jgi:hypothetical protein
MFIKRKDGERKKTRSPYLGDSNKEEFRGT